MGEDGVDTDLPTRLELLVLNNVLGKTFFVYVTPASVKLISSPLQHIPDLILRTSSRLRESSTYHAMAYCKYCHSIAVRLCVHQGPGHQCLHLPGYLKLLCRQSASVRRAFHRRALPVGWT